MSGISVQKAQAFATKWADAKNEKQEAQSFWMDFFLEVCGIADIRSAGIEFEKTVISSLKGSTNWIDVFWKDTLLIEHKSAGKNLDEAEAQARGYLVSLAPRLRPPVIIVSDFQNIRIVDVLLNTKIDFPLSELPNQIPNVEKAIGLNSAREIKVEVEADEAAAALMANLYQTFDDAGFQGHQVSVFLVRILFLLFGDDTRMFKSGLFKEFLADTSEEGRDLGGRLQELFQALDSRKESRPKTIDSYIEEFPYINGGLFSESLPIFPFTKQMRQALLNASAYDWSRISPAIFGSMFQMIKSKEARRELGEHYTTERNIHRVIDPLFLDDLQEELSKSWDSQSKLKNLKNRLGQMQFLDPACGCGNFLVVTYKALRQIELEIIIRLQNLEGKQLNYSLDGTWGLSVSLEQFSGIEFEEWSSQIATVAMFLADHQENIALEKVTGAAPDRFPLKESATILHANAISTDWKQLVRFDENTYLLGNPPFIGMSLMTSEQQADNRLAFEPYEQVHTRTGRLDYVACWYAKAITYMKGTRARAAFVSTNSITQGEQARTLAPLFAENNVKIDFAHQTFKWTSDAAGAAAVHVVIIGFSDDQNQTVKQLFEYVDLSGAPSSKQVKALNFYLVEGPDVELVKLRQPLVSGYPNSTIGSKPADGGNLFISDDEIELAKQDAIASKYLHRFLGATELLYSKERWVLWLVDANPGELRQSKFIQEKLKRVAEMRQQSPTKSVREKANSPYLFTEIRQPSGQYIGMPCVSSENREYIPARICKESEIAGNGILTFPGSEKWLLPYLQSKAFTNWVETFSGRLKSDFQILPAISYFTFPFLPVSESLKDELGKLADELVSVRDSYASSTLADLYDPLAMPPPLRALHKKIDAKIDSYYGLKGDVTKGERLGALLVAYNRLISEGKLQD
jgi:hypothetical protein